MTTLFSGPVRLRLIAAVLLIASLLSLKAAHAAIYAGYSEYYVPGRERQMWDVFEDLDNRIAANLGGAPQLDISQGMHTVISITTTGDNTTIYYDHWEDGYDFDPANPATADVTWVRDAGEVITLTENGIPVDPRGTTVRYDGGDRIYVAGTAVTVSRTSWPQSAGPVFAISWELFPVKPFLTDYTVPVGRDIATASPNYSDFERVYVLVQSVTDNNVIQIDDPTTPYVDITTTLNRGETAELFNVNAGTHVKGLSPVQVHFIVGSDTRDRYEARGFNAMPEALWDNEYYAPVGGAVNGDTDIYLYNPHSTAIIVSYEDSAGSGSFTIPAGSTVSYQDGAGRYVPNDSGVYLNSDNIFWGISSVDTESRTYDWGYSLVPVNFLTDEYFLSWAPGTSDTNPGANGSPAFVTPIYDDTVIFIDYSPTDGVIDQTVTRNRLETLTVFDPDNVNTGMHIFANGPIALAWGQDPDTAGTGNPYLDLGTANLPMPPEWIDLTLGTEKSADPTVLAPVAGKTTTFTVKVLTYEFPVADIAVQDTLPSGFSYINNSAVITLPDNTVIVGVPANPSIAGQVLTWDNATLNGLDMAAHKTLKITYGVVIDGSVVQGQYANTAQGSGTRLLGSQVFSPFDSAIINVSPLVIDKDSVTKTVSGGGTAQYTIRIENISDTDASNMTITDSLPAGFTFASTDSIATTSGVLPLGPTPPASVPSAGQTNLTWGPWFIDSQGEVLITFTVNVGSSVTPGVYDNTVSADGIWDGGPISIDDKGPVGQDLGTPSGEDPENDEDVEVVSLLLDMDTATPTVSAGGQVVYTITVQNDGDSPITGADISASLPPGFTYASTANIAITDNGTGGDTMRTSTSNPTAGDDTPEWGTWTIGPDDVVVITFVADVAGTVTPGTYDASAFLDSPQTGLIDDAGPVAGDAHTLPSDTGTDEDVTVQTAVLTIDKDAITKYAVTGSTGVTWEIAVTNTGTADATNATVSDTLPGGFSYAAGTAQVTLAGGATGPSGQVAPTGGATITWGTFTIPAGGSVTVRFDADVTAAGSSGGTAYDNTASAASDQTGTIDDIGTIGQDTNTPPLEDPETDEDVVIFDGPTVNLDVDIAHTQDLDTDFIDYLVNVTNLGPSPEPGPITVSATLPAGIDYLGFSGTGWTFVSQVGQTLTFSYTGGVLAVGAALPTLTVNTEIGTSVSPAVTYIADTTVSGTLNDYDLSNNTDSDPVAAAISDLSTSTKTVVDVNGGDVEPGDILVYTITLIETGGKRAKFVSVTDHMPPNVNSFTVTAYPTTPYTDDSTYAGTGSSGTGFLDINGFDVPKNGTMVITFQVTVDAGTPDGTTIDNQALIDNPRGFEANPSAPTLIVRGSALPGTGSKPLYLFGNLDLSRQVPGAGQATVTLPNTNNDNDPGDFNFESETFTLTPALQKELRIDSSSGSIPLIVWLARQDYATWRRLYARLDVSGPVNATIGTYLNPSTSEQMPATPTQYNVSIPIDTGTWDAGSPGDEIVLPAGTVITLTLASHEVTGASAGDRTIVVYPDEGTLTSRSQVLLTANTVVNVDSVAFYDAAYPGGATIATVLPGNTVYIRAAVSDPFGYADITGATVDLVDKLGTVHVNDGVMYEAPGGAGGDTRIYEYQFTFPANAEVDNWTAFVTAAEGSEGTVTDIGQGVVTVTTVTGADLSIAKNHSDTFTYNQQGSFTIRARNNGPEAQTASVVVADAIPNGMTYVGASGTGWGCAFNAGAGANGTVTCTYPASSGSPVPAGFDLPPITLTVMVGDSATTPSTIPNTASVAPGVGENNPANDSDTDTVNILALGVTKNDNISGPYYYAGDNLNGALQDEVDYTVTVTNSSDGVVRRISVTDNLPAGVTYVPGSAQVTLPDHPIRVNEYYIADGDFTGTTHELVLRHDLAEDYFVIIQGSDGDGTTNNNRGPDSTYVAITADPFGTGDLDGLSRPDAILLTRGGSTDAWVGVVTVVESVYPSDPDGFQLLDVVEIAQNAGATTGSDNSALGWSDESRVVLFGSANGAGCLTGEASNNNMVTCWTRLAPQPASSSQINWSRNAGGASLGAAVTTVMVTQWGGNWTIQHRRVQGTGGGDGADQTGEYNTSAISSVTRANTWVWGTGFTNDNGLGDGAEGVLITLGDGVNQNSAESTLAVGTEYGGTAVDVEVWALTHPQLAVDYRFKPDEYPDATTDTNATTYDQTVDAAQGWRMALVTNGSNGTGTAYPRPQWWARYTDDTTVRLERRRAGQPFPAWIQGINFSNIGGGTVSSAASAPPGMVTAADDHSLLPGESLTVTFKATIDDANAPGPVNNTVLVTADGFTDTAVATSALEVRTLGLPDFTDGSGNAVSGDTISYSGGATEAAYLKLVDKDRNVASDVIDTLNVTVINPLTGDSITVTLYETGPNTGIFANDSSGERYELPIVSCADPQDNCCSNVANDPLCTPTEKAQLPTAAASLYVVAGTTPELQLAYADPADSTRDSDTATAFIATRVVLSDVGVYIENGRGVLYWVTAAEQGTAAFNVMRYDETALTYRHVNAAPLTSLMGKPMGGIYRLVDEGLRDGGAVSYLIEEIETRGRVNRYGPFTVPVTDPPTAVAALGPMSDDYHRDAHAVTVSSAAAGALSVFSRGAMDTVMVGDAIKITVSAAGLYYVGADTVGAYLGIDPVDVVAMIGAGELRLSRGDRTVPYQVAPGGSGLYFYGIPADNLFAAANVYWLRPGNGFVMAGVDALRGDVTGTDGVTMADAVAALRVAAGVSAGDTGIRSDYRSAHADVSGNQRVDTAEALYVIQHLAGLRPVAGTGDVTPVVGAQHFTAHLRLEQDLLALTDFFTDPRADYWVWTAGDSNTPAAVPVPLAALAGDGGIAPVTAQVHLYGAYDDPAVALDHHVAVYYVQSSDGLATQTVTVPVGEGLWDGHSSHTVTTADLRPYIGPAGTNYLVVVDVPDTGAALNRFAVDAVDISYPRTYEADGSLLAFTGGGNEKVTVAGFASADIRVFDVSDPYFPQVVTHFAIDGAAGDYRLTFRPEAPEIPYVAVTADTGAAPANLSAIVDSDLRQSEHQVDYVVIAPAEFENEASRLADYRATQGLATKVVRFEDIADTFGAGFNDPAAIGDFLKFAYDNWQRAPRFVALAGNGTYDYRNLESAGDNKLPALMVATTTGLFPSDQALADVTGADGVPDIAIGRLPAASLAELAGLVDQVMAFESGTGIWRTRAIVSAGDVEYAGESSDFKSDSQAVAQWLPPAMTTQTVYKVDGALNTDMVAAINGGALLLNYLGHGGYDRLAGLPSLLDLANDLPNLTNADQRPIMSALTCVVGNYGIPGADTLGEAMVKGPAGGAIAVWSPSGESINAKAVLLNEAYFKQLRSANDGRLGTIIKNALGDYFERTDDGTLVRIYNLLGDPALLLPEGIIQAGDSN